MKIKVQKLFVKTLRKESGGWQIFFCFYKELKTDENKITLHIRQDNNSIIHKNTFNIDIITAH